MSVSYYSLDWKLILTAVALTLIGVALISSAQYYSGSEALRGYYLKQLLWFAISALVFAVVLHVPLRLFDASAYLLYGISLVLLIAIFFVGSTRLGATRWFSLGPINLSPSDIAKIAILLSLARYFAYIRGNPVAPKNLIGSLALTLIPMALVLKQPDLGTSLVFIALLIGLWFWAGLSPGFLALALSPGISMIASANIVAWVLFFVVLLALIFYLRPGLFYGSTTVLVNLACGMITPFVWNGLQNYQKLRILTFLDPGRDPRGAGYQIIQSRISIGSGGLTGKGFLNSTQSRLEFLPERHTDFIFSVLGEEFGFIGAMIVLGLFLYLLYRMVRIALKCRSKFSSYLVFGAATIILFQTFINIGMTIGITPVTGLPLPFLSYGGTSLVFNWALVALAVSAGSTWREY